MGTAEERWGRRWRWMGSIYHSWSWRLMDVLLMFGFCLIIGLLKYVYRDNGSFTYEHQKKVRLQTRSMF